MGLDKEPLIGRRVEKRILTEAVKSRQAEFVAVYGRRRVGKTFLVRSVLNQPTKVTFFQLTGSHQGQLGEQLRNFADAWQRCFSESIPAPSSWQEAFRFMRSALELKLTRDRRPTVLFFDELPWLCGKNHRFLSALEHFWNDWAETQPLVKVLVCGSAASWMVKRVVRARGGLHNRLTRRIQLSSFSILEFIDYLKHKKIRYTPYDAVKAYLVLGGVPYYLRSLERGLSVDQNIHVLCFSEHAPLATEFDDLYDSLFTSASTYKALVTILSRHHRGLTRQQLVDTLPQGSGGGLTQILDNLEASGFVSCISSFEGASKRRRYRLVDEFSQFSLRFQKPRKRGAFHSIAGSPAFRAWAGLAFETFCLRHIPLLLQELGISGVVTRAAQFWRPGTTGKDGLQVDLLFDREDNVIDLCEMKFSSTPFVIDKRYAELLRRRIQGFIESTGTRKSVHNVVVTVAGLKKNSYSQELVDKEVRFDSLLG